MSYDRMGKRNMQFVVANAAGGITDPTDITGLILWFDAEDSSTITLNGSDVSQWDDKSAISYEWIFNEAMDALEEAITCMEENDL